MTRSEEGRTSHRKDGNIESAVDALSLVEWLASILLDRYQDSFGRGFHVSVQIDMEPTDGGYNDE